LLAARWRKNKEKKSAEKDTGERKGKREGGWVFVLLSHGRFNLIVEPHHFPFGSIRVKIGIVTNKPRTRSYGIGGGVGVCVGLHKCSGDTCCLREGFLVNEVPCMKNELLIHMYVEHESRTAHTLRIVGYVLLERGVHR
jgi:hypothetical protein